MLCTGSRRYRKRSVDRAERALNPVPVVLEGDVVRLEPLEQHHGPDLLAAAADPEIWRYLPCAQPRTGADMQAFIAKALKPVPGDEQIPFAVLERSSGKAIGSTRYLDIRRGDRALEIGWTWYATSAQRTAVNTECKLLLLRHAFDTLGAIRVQLKTDGRNLRSQQAIERLGAVKEGVLRKQRILPDGYVRDAVYYSILDSEWPGVRVRLERMLRGEK